MAGNRAPRSLVEMVATAILKMGSNGDSKKRKRRLPKSNPAKRISSGDPTGGRPGRNAAAVREILDPKHGKRGK